MNDWLDQEQQELTRVLLACGCHYACRFSAECTDEHHVPCYDTIAKGVKPGVLDIPVQP